jgi:sodium/pantothenate symporter
MPDVSSHGFSVLFALLAFLAVSVWLGTLAQRAMDRSNFFEGFFLGNRGLGAWTLALTATVQSGGTFMGYPALVYDYGWVGLLWISSYMVVPLTGFAVIGKRLAQLSRKTGAVTVPEIFSERFGDARVGLCASLMIMFFLSFTMCAQFKAGATVMKQAWPGSGPFTFAEPAFDEPETASPSEANTNEKVPAEIAASGPAAAQQPVSAAPAGSSAMDTKYYIGLAVFAATVVGYTMIGGFLASVWTDLFQSVLMVVGVMVLFCLALPAAGGLEHATRTAIEYTGPAYALGPGFHPTRDFLTPALAFSMFVLWVYSGFASPASMIRVMAAQNTEVMRKSIVLLSCYNCLIYVPLAMIAICGRALYPHEKPDEIIPTLAMRLTTEIPGGTLLTALILSAPFGAIMASVSCFVLVIASGLVKDLYLRYVHPQATAHEIRRATNIAMLLVGVVGVLAVIYPPKYLQVLIVFSGSAGAAAFVTPVLMTCYWRRATSWGMLSAMLGGFLTYVTLFALGWLQGWAAGMQPPNSFAEWVLSVLGQDPRIGPATAFRAYYFLGFDPIVWGLLVSAVCGIAVSRLTPPPQESLLQRLFDATPPTGEAVAEAA